MVGHVTLEIPGYAGYVGEMGLPCGASGMPGKLNFKIPRYAGHTKSMRYSSIPGG